MSRVTPCEGPRLLSHGTSAATAVEYSRGLTRVPPHENRRRVRPGSGSASRSRSWEVTSSVRSERRRTTQPRSSIESSSAAPSAPATWGRRSVQSHARAHQRPAELLQRRDLDPERVRVEALGVVGNDERAVALLQRAVREQRSRERDAGATGQVVVTRASLAHRLAAVDGR